jgi:single-strand DNA-binding protein
MQELLTQLIQCNQWRFIGRLGADPELRCFQSGASVCNARLLVNKPGQKRDDGQKPYSFKLEIWNDKAQEFVDAAGKGDLVDVEGRIKTETWDDKQTGEKRQALVLSVEAWEVLAKPGQNQQAQQQSPAKPASQSWLGSDSGSDDSDVPF